MSEGQKPVLPLIRRTVRPNIDTIEEMLRDRPYAAQLLQFQVFFDMASMLEDLTAQIGSGKVDRLDITVTDEAQKVSQKTDTLPWICFDIHNDGVKDVFFENNSTSITEVAPIHSMESLRVDARGKNIMEILLKCRKGETTTVRLYGTY